MHPGSTVVHAGLALGALLAALLSGCSLHVDFDGSKFACSDGVCPTGFTCGADAWCTPDEPPADAGPDLDATDPEPPDGAPPDAPDPCAGQAKVVSGGRCYGLFLAAASWTQAKASCEAAGGQLATVTSAQENQIVAGLLTGNVKDAWLGATDQAVENTFVWASGEPFSFSNWRTGEPNNGGINASFQEDCAVMELDNGGTWDDRNCVSSFPYICESP